MHCLTRAVFCLSAILLFLTASPAQTKTCSGQAGPARYEGRYRFANGTILLIYKTDGLLAARPIFWTSVQTIDQKENDLFIVSGREDRRLIFKRGEDGCVNAVRIEGFGDDSTLPKLGPEKVPAEFLMEGKPLEAARMMIAANPNSSSEAVALAESILEKRPSQSADAVRFLLELSRQFPADASVFAALGTGYIGTNDRAAALAAFRKADNLDPANEKAKAGLRRLDALNPAPAEAVAGWKLPFSLDALFAPPTAAEIKQAEAEWSHRDLSPKDVRTVTTGEIDLGRTKAAVKIISHRVHGFLHYGAIIIPEQAKTGTHPVILDLKGVSPSFFPLDLDRLISPDILGDRQGQFIYFVPAFRGERLLFGGREYRSEGDPTDSWDGAADDALAFLNAALGMTPQADKTRIAAFGKSRGGALAMLAGARDKRIARVVSWSGPVDFFKMMGEGGWHQKEVVSEALLHRAKPEDDGGQFVATFLAKAIAGKKTLAEVRRLMIQSSVFYFAGRLPRLEAYYGVEDGMVPVRNGRALERALKNIPGRKVIYHQDAGHDLNPKLAYPESKRFLIGMLHADRQYVATQLVIFG